MKRSHLIVLGLAFLLTSCTGSNEKPEYYRVKHDSQLEKFDYRSRTAARDWHGVSSETPETVPLFVLPEEGTGTHRTKFPEELETFIDSLNKNNERTLRYLKANNTGLFNTAGFPQLESLTMGGNVITLVEIENDWGKVHTLDPGQIYSPEDVNYITYPDLIHKFVVVGWRKTSKETYWTNPPPGDMYWPLVSSRDIWISFERLEKFPDLPVKVTANTIVYIQRTPGPANEPTLQRLFKGQSATVVEYYPSGSNVWGKLRTGGWIALLWYPEIQDLQYPTTWTMETLPPPPPVE
jgi:hypothetical protein